MIKRLTIAAYGIAFCGLLVLSPTSHAQQSSDRNSGWTGRVWAGVVCRCVEDDNVTFQDPTFGTVGLEVDGNSLGIGFDVERRLGKLIGLEYRTH